MWITKLCSYAGCGQLAERGATRCAQHRADDRDRLSPDRRGYDRRWKRFRAWFLQANPFCVDCLPGRVEPATEVHHIHKLAAGGERLDPSNCMALCHACHSRRTARGE